jgi:hypothetical protein
MRTGVPGVYREDVLPSPPTGLRTGVPAFIAPALLGPPRALASAAHLGADLRERLRGTATLAAVAGFFTAGGTRCHVVGCDPGSSGDALDHALAEIDELEDVDLVAAPDLARGLDGPRALAGAASRAARLLAACERAPRLALLSAPGPGVRCGLVDLRGWVRELAALPGARSAALYHPWVVHDGASVPPDGHVAGVIAATDARVGVHKPPANELVRGLIDLDVALGVADQQALADLPINCIRALPGRGIRVWGARTLAGEPVSVRRTVLTIRRELTRRFAERAFEANDAWLWNRIARELGAYLQELFQRGVLRGQSAVDAFHIRCDEATNPPELRDAGVVCAEVGVAPATPREFITLRLQLGAQAHAASVDETTA